MKYFTHNTLQNKQAEEKIGKRQGVRASEWLAEARIIYTLPIWEGVIKGTLGELTLGIALHW